MAHQVGIIGSGNWGSTVGKIIATNVKTIAGFSHKVNIYVHEEIIDGVKLTDIINSKHENVKYLPGVALPESLIACSDLERVTKESSHLIFVTPHQFVLGLCQKMKPHVKPNAVAITLIKGLSEASKDLELISHVIKKELGIHVSVLAGANIATEIAKEQFSETTIGCDNEELGKVWKSLFHTKYFKVSLISDPNAMEICGAMKNGVAVGAGFVDALGYGNNTKAAFIRIGLVEIMRFTRLFFPDTKAESYLESFGVADLITTCYGGRNHKVSVEFIRQKKSIEELEQQMLNGQKLQGPATVDQVMVIIKEKNLEHEFPLFTTIYKILHREIEAEDLLKHLEGI